MRFFLKMALSKTFAILTDNALFYKGNKSAVENWNNFEQLKEESKKLID